VICLGYLSKLRYGNKLITRLLRKYFATKTYNPSDIILIGWIICDSIVPDLEKNDPNEFGEPLGIWSSNKG
jgi:hypothetical protein